ncbi:MAG: hypothetical protein ACFCU8_07710 [Thermosynechococcaceae cyanobacterium]
MTQQQFKSKTGLATLLAFGLSAGSLTPFLTPQPATAQLLPGSSRRVRVAEGTIIETTYEDAERIILKPDETLPLTLTTTSAVRSANGTILIPWGSTIEGKLQPQQDGTQFVADTLIFKDGTRFNIEASSDIITRTEEVKRGRNLDRVWQGALVGGAAAAVISEIFGEVGIFKVLAGTGAGALGGYLLSGRKKAEVRVIDPKTDLNLNLESDLFLN